MVYDNKFSSVTIYIPNGAQRSGIPVLVNQTKDFWLYIVLDICKL